MDQGPLFGCPAHPAWTCDRGCCRTNHVCHQRLASCGGRSRRDWHRMRLYRWNILGLGMGRFPLMTLRGKESRFSVFDSQQAITLLPSPPACRKLRSCRNIVGGGRGAGGEGGQSGRVFAPSPLTPLTPSPPARSGSANLLVLRRRGRGKPGFDTRLSIVTGRQTPATPDSLLLSLDLNRPSAFPKTTPCASHS